MVDIWLVNAGMMLPLMIMMMMMKHVGLVDA